MSTKKLRLTESGIRKLMNQEVEETFQNWLEERNYRNIAIERYEKIYTVDISMLDESYMWFQNSSYDGLTESEVKEKMRNEIKRKYKEQEILRQSVKQRGKTNAMQNKSRENLGGSSGMFDTSLVSKAIIEEVDKMVLYEKNMVVFESKSFIKSLLFSCLIGRNEAEAFIRRPDVLQDMDIATFEECNDTMKTFYDAFKCPPQVKMEMYYRFALIMYGSCLSREHSSARKMLLLCYEAYHIVSLGMRAESKRRKNQNAINAVRRDKERRAKVKRIKDKIEYLRLKEIRKVEREKRRQNRRIQKVKERKETLEKARKLDEDDSDMSEDEKRTRLEEHDRKADEPISDIDLSGVDPDIEEDVEQEKDKAFQRQEQKNSAQKSTVKQDDDDDEFVVSAVSTRDSTRAVVTVDASVENVDGEESLTDEEEYMKTEMAKRDEEKKEAQSANAIQDKFKALMAAVELAERELEKVELGVKCTVSNNVLAFTRFRDPITTIMIPDNIERPTIMNDVLDSDDENDAGLAPVSLNNGLGLGGNDEKESWSEYLLNVVSECVPL